MGREGGKEREKEAGGDREQFVLILCEKVNTWMYSSNGTCRCGANIRGTIRCSTDPDRVSVRAYVCMSLT